jgi:ACS family glucarate transporter-like MFS transporter
LVLALVFWSFVREGPRQHPLVNAAELALIEQSEPGGASSVPLVPAAVLWKGIISSRSLWLSAFVQFGTNFGWIFLGNLFPLYLQRAHQVPEIERGWMVSLPFMVSLPMMIVGGWWTDRMTRVMGARWGRCLPLALTRLVASAAFLSCLLFDAPWPITVALCIFSLASDMGLPSMWAYCMDVGGRNVGVVLAWGNMWGNLGAACSTSTLIFIQGYFQGKAGWDAVFITCAAVFAVIGVASFGIDATRPIAPQRQA